MTAAIKPIHASEVLHHCWTPPGTTGSCPWYPTMAARDFDAHVVGDLQLDRVVAHLGDRAEDAAGGDDRSPTFSAEELLHLLLPLPHRQHHHEIEDAQNEHERNELQPRARRGPRRRAHGQQ